MACFGPSPSSSTSQIANSSCLQKPLTKAALIVISLLFAGGAIASHFAGLGIPGIVAFSLASGGCLMIVCIIACCRSSLKKEQAATTQEIKTPVSQMSTSELIRNMTPVILKTPLAIKGAANNQTAPNEDNRLILDTLGSKIKDLFSTHSTQGEDAIAQALQPLFSQVQSSPDKFETLVMLVVMGSRYLPKYIATVLEKLEWPNEEMKNQILPKCLGMRIAQENISWQREFINLGDTEEDATSDAEEVEPNGFYTNRLVVNTKKIFGNGDFTTHPIPMPDSLAKAIGYAIRISAEAMIADLQEKKEQGTLDEDTNIGIHVVIGQHVECRFPASMIAPMLPYLTNIPGLVGFELIDIGLRNTWDSKATSKNGHGFREQDAEALLAIFRTNPYLTKMEIILDGMSAEKQEEFCQKRHNICITRTKQPPRIEQLLSLPSPEKH